MNRLRPKKTPNPVRAEFAANRNAKLTQGLDA